MKKLFLIVAFFAISFLSLTSTSYAIPPFEWFLKSTNNGAPQQRTFVFSPAVNTGSNTTSQVQTWLNTNNEQVLEGYVGSGVWSFPWFNNNQWYTIKAKQNFLPCTETVFRVRFSSNHDWTSAPTMEWRSGGTLGSYGRMFMNGGSYPSPHTIGVTYNMPTYSFRWDTVYNCIVADPVEREVGE
jgi:hypothetical protein